MAAPTSKPASGGRSKPKGAPRSKGAPKGHRKPAPAAATDQDGQPTVKVPMVWAAFGSDIGGEYTAAPGLLVQCPQVKNTIRAAGGNYGLDEDQQNAAIVPFPRAVAEGLSSQYGMVKVVKGKRLTSLEVYDVNQGSSGDYIRLTGANSVLWSEFQATHAPQAVRVTDWRAELRVTSG